MFEVSNKKQIIDHGGIVDISYHARIFTSLEVLLVQNATKSIRNFFVRPNDEQLKTVKQACTINTKNCSFDMFIHLSLFIFFIQLELQCYNEHIK